MVEASPFTALPWEAFLRTEGLTADYRELAERWFLPLASDLAVRRRRADAPLLVGINGCQGSGKSTLAALLSMVLTEGAGLRVAVLSLDDFYLTRTEREWLADTVHPLLATRGVPGTHDTDLISTVLDSLCHGSSSVRVPRFDKAEDDRAPRSDWAAVPAPVDVVIWEGWCLGVAPQPDALLDEPINALEVEEDAQATWRRWVNRQLAGEYQALFARVDCWVMLAAPSFDCVAQWRGEQEAKLIARRGADHPGILSPRALRRFVQFYQRLTQWSLATLPGRVDYRFDLDDQRRVTAVTPAPVEAGAS